jgi:hypothetical protein
MIPRAVFLLALVVLLAGICDAWRLPSATAQDVLPTPVGQLGGREPLPSAVGASIAPPTSPTPAPADHSLVGAWSLTFPDEDRAPARLVLATDRLVGFVDGGVARGSGAWAETGPARGVLAVAIRAMDAPARDSGITVLQGTIALGPGDDMATLEYTTSRIDESGTPAALAGPFRATGQRADEA